jgi:MFS family permease
VDPILPAIAKNRHASPSQVELLFTSYFAFTGVSMLVSSAVASRIGAKRTLLAGLVLHSYGTHTDVATEILRRAADIHAGAIVLGPDTRPATLTSAVTAYIAAHAPRHVIVINPEAGALGRPAAAAAHASDPGRLRNGSPLRS